MRSSQKNILLQFQACIRKAKHNISPILNYAPDDLVWLDFSAANAALASVDLQNTALFSDFVNDQIKVKGGKVGIGGYNENRVIYKRSSNFDGTEPRTVHLGMDVWLAAYTPIYAPLDAVVHSFKNNTGFGNYGETLILQHQQDGFTFYTLYGHLSASSTRALYRGKEIKSGEAFAWLGDVQDNGNWPPHLHFQVIFDLEGYEGDYPGVAAPSQKSHFLANCPDPACFLLPKQL